MSKFAGFIIGAIEVGVGIATGNPALIISGTEMIIAQAVVDLTAPKTPSRQASEMSIALGEQPRVALFGETFTPGSLVDGFDFGGKYGTDWEVLVIRLADHKCHSLTGFFVNDDYNVYRGDGLVGGQYDDQLEIYFRADTTSVPLPAIVTTNGPGWTSADIGQSGCDVIVAYKADKEKDKHPGWPGGRPRFGFVVKGKFCYDPRNDDTVPGGSGAHRWDDPDTWEWSENAVVCWYNYERGIFADDDVSDPTKLLVGRGLTADESPPEYIFAAANLCDEDLGTAYPAQWIATGTSYPSDKRAFSPDGRFLYTIHGTAFGAVYLPTRSDYTNTTITAAGGHIAATDDGVYLTRGDELWMVDRYGTETIITDSTGMISTDVSYASGAIWMLTDGFDPHKLGKYEGGAITLYAINFNATQVFENAEGDPISVGTTSGNILAIGPAGSAATLINTTSYGTSGPVYGFDPNVGNHYIVRQGNYLFLINKTTLAIASAVNVGADPGGLYEAFAATPIGSTTFWNGNTEYASADLSTLRSIDTSSFTAYGQGGVELSGFLYDRINNALISPTNGDPGLIFRFLDRHGNYRVAGPIYSNQAFIDVEQMFAAATGGSIVTRDGAVELEPGHAKSIVATITDADLIVGSKASWNNGVLSESSDDWVNTVVATYVEPDQKWNSHAAPAVRNTATIIADGKPREQQLTLRLVRYQPQALRIAEIGRRLGRLWGRATVTIGPRFCELEDGDWVSWQSDRYFSGGTKTFRIDAYQIDEKWQNTLTLREISADAFAADGVFAPDLSIPTTTAPPPEIGQPSAANWTLAATALASAGISVPALEVTGSADDDPYVEQIIIEYWKDDGSADPTDPSAFISWYNAGFFPPDTTTVDITSVTAGSYYASVTYVVDETRGDRLVLGPVTLSGITIGSLNTADITGMTADTTLHTADLG